MLCCKLTAHMLYGEKVFLHEKTTQNEPTCIFLRAILFILMPPGILDEGGSVGQSGVAWYATVKEQFPSSHISLGHPVGANTEQIRTFSGISQFFVQCTKISFCRGGGYVYTF